MARSVSHKKTSVVFYNEKIIALSSERINEYLILIALSLLLQKNLTSVIMMQKHTSVILFNT